jgi:hypothetical protein
MTWTEGKLQLLTCYLEVHKADLCISKPEYMSAQCAVLDWDGILSIAMLQWQKLHVWPDKLPSLTDNLSCLLLFSCSICTSLRSKAQTFANCT